MWTLLLGAGVQLSHRDQPRVSWSTQRLWDTEGGQRRLPGGSGLVLGTKERKGLPGEVLGKGAVLGTAGRVGEGEGRRQEIKVRLGDSSGGNTGERGRRRREAVRQLELLPEQR